MKDNMSFIDDHHLNTSSESSHITHVINHINTGIWEFNVNTGEVKWSDSFYRLLGYEPGEIECSYNYFIEQLLYHGDRKILLKSINDRGTENVSTVNIRLLTKKSGYQWFEHTTRRGDDVPCISLYGSIININAYKLIELQSSQKDSLFNEASKIAKIAIWELEVSSMSLSLSKEGYDIFELSNPIRLSVDEAVSFFEPSHRPAVTEAIENVIKYCHSFDLELPFRTARNKVIWVRFKAIPVIDNFGRCISLKGILQDIDYIKKREIEVEKALALANDQNKRLQNFAYIVSHNLRSHTKNLKFMVNLYQEPDSKNESEEIFDHIKSISDSLNTTVEHLEEVVKIQAEITKDKKIIYFEPLFKDLMRALSNNISEANAKIEFDFSRCPKIDYIPAYMESILQNLLTNALKYRHPDRQPVIKCFTFIKNKQICLVFEDNGIGIDLTRHGNDVFGMYKTFHQNNDAKGIGLFITRNQVESLGGTIKIESTVDIGTKFTICLT
jgi:signal transduction histidine kinase